MTDAASQRRDPPPQSVETGGPVLIELRFAATASRLKVVRPSIHAAALMCGFAELTARDIVLAVDEACQNIIVHGYAAAGHRPAARDIELTVYQRRNGIRVELRDLAAAVDPDAIQPRDLARIRPGGLGTHFIRQIMDKVEYLPNPDGVGNTMHLIKYHRPVL